MKDSTHEDEEEDFFAMLEKEEDAPPPQLIQTNDSVAMSANVVPVLTERNPSLEPAHHSLASDSDHELAAPSMAHPVESDIVFEENLSEFYSKYNFGNLEKVKYLADKFCFRRWELWEQLCIKYKLSPEESRLLFIKFNISHEGINECSRKLFHNDEIISIPDDAMSLRKAAWRKLLGLSTDESQQELYMKYASELAPPELLAGISSENSDIARDVYRTHQELSLFREEETKRTMIEILTIYTRLNGLDYVQGMNELLGIIFYVMRSASDSFWAFSCIMSQIKDFFTAEADSTREGIYFHIDTLQSLLRQYNYRLWKHFNEVDFPVATLAMRWMTTLLIMDLNIADATRLMDVTLQSCRTHQLLTFSTCLSLGYLLTLADHLLMKSEIEDSVEICAHFGRTADANVEQILTNSLSIYAFESILRGRYTPSSDEPVFEALAEAVDSVKMRVVQAVTSEQAQKTKEELVGRVNQAKSVVSNWLGTLVATLPSALTEKSEESSCIAGDEG